MKYQKTQKPLLRWVLPLLLLVLQAFSPVHAQSDLVLVGGSDFLDKAHSDTLWCGDLNLIETVGPEGSKFTSAITHADSAQMFQDSSMNLYAVTTNPHLLDSTYVDVDQNMLVAHIAYNKDDAVAANTKLISYKISGIKKGSDFKVTFKLWGLNGTDYGVGHNYVSWDPWDISAGIDLDQYGSSSCDVKESFKVTPGNVVEVTLEGTLPDNLDYIKLDIATGYNYKYGCTLGISDLRVYGVYKPHVTSSMGIEICAGEQALISLDKEYNADSYKWYSSTNGKTFDAVGSKKNLYEQLKTADATFYYYCIVNGLPSDTIAIKTITCCVDGEGNPMSRMDVFYDDFGYFDDLRSYTDAFGKSTVFDNTYAPERADVTFDLSATGMKFDKSGQINDGNYGVVVPSPTGYYQDISGNSRATWMAGVTSDHSGLVSGKSGGGALFMNITMNYSDLIFTRTIDGLCTDKNLYFETYIANMSGGTDPEVTINIKDATTGKVLASDKQTATAGAGWIRVHIDELKATSSSIILEIVSTGTGNSSYWEKGNDLIIDDIRFMVCSPPSVDIYSNLSSYASDTTICANTDFTMGSQVSDLLNSFFDGKQQYLFQQSTDGKVWNNMGAISSEPTYKFNTEKYPADTNYFRVVVATSDALQQFLTNPSNADYEDKCRSYSISKSFKIIRAGAIDMGKDMTYSECGGTELTMNGSNDGTLVRWGWEDADGNVLVATTTDEDAKQYVYKVTDDAVLTFVGYNKEGCLGKRKFTVTKKNTVEFTLADTKECALTTVTATGAPTGSEFKWIYDGSELAETGSSVKIDTSYADATIKAVASATGYCESDTVTADVTILTFPDAPVPVKTLMSQQVKAGASVSLEEMVSSTEGIQWSTASNGKYTDTWSTTVPSQSLATAGTFTYWIRAISEDNCPSDTVRLTVVINEAPMPEVRNDTVCVGTVIDFTKYITKHDEGFTLMYYNTEDGKGTENPNTYTATMGGMVLDYWVSQKSDAAESDKAHMQVVVANVAQPKVTADSVVYCLNSEATELTATVTPNAARYIYANGTEWRIGDDVVTDLTPSTATAGSTVYSVYGTFNHPTTLNGEAVCYSEPTTIKVVVSESPVPTSSTSPEFTYSYLKTDGDATGSFTDVMTASASQIAVAAGADYTLVWYDADGNKLSGAPVPPYDANQEEDMTYTYQVSQVNAYGCESEKVKVTVNVNGTPAPVVRDSAICSGDTYSLADKVTSSGATFKLQWYTAATGGTASDAAPALTETTPGEYTYYVSQINNETGAESRRVPIKVTIYGVKAPNIVVAETTYCKGATAASLNTMASIAADASTFYMADADLVWQNDGGVTLSDLVPSTAVTTTTSYTYSASQTYTIPTSGEVCKGEAVNVTVNVTVLDAPAVSAVNYLKTDAADNGGSFKNLLEQNDQAAVASTGCTLNWFGTDKSALSSVPAPAYDASLEGDAEYTYFVSQSDANGCESEMVPVTVTISSSPMPTTEPVAYCEGDETATALTAKVSLVGNGDAESDYTLVWYGTQNPNNLATEAEKEAIASTTAPVPSTAVTNGEAFQVYTYYVAQKRTNADGKEVVSRATALIDSVYAKPQLTTDDPAPVCAPATVDLSASNLWNVVSAKVWNKAYTDASGVAVANPAAIAESGDFLAQAYFEVRGKQCASEQKSIKVEVDYIKDLAIEGSQTTCPGTSVGLSATTTDVYPTSVSYTWVSAESGDNQTVTISDMTTSELPGPAGRTYTYTLSATAGACSVTADAKHTITIGDGPISGTVAFAEDGNTGATSMPASNTGVVFYSCGNAVTVTADVESTADDLVWTLNGAQVGTGKTLTVTPATGTSVYKLSYTNSCPTGFDVSIVSVPVSAVLGQTSAYNMCEGDNFSTELIVSCPENTYKVAWYQDGVELTNETATALKFSPATPANDGVYTYKVSNRGCSVTGEVADGNALKVRPYIQLTYESNYVARRDSQLSIPLNITVPAGSDPASIKWSEGGAEFATGTPLSLKVTADHNFKVALSDDNYCDAEANISVQMDARLKLSVALGSQICAGDVADLVIDTTGTGKFVYPNAVSIVVNESTTSGNTRTYTSGWTLGDDGNLHLAVSPTSDATFEVNFSYRQPADGVDYQMVSSKASISVLEPVSLSAPQGLTMCGDGEESLDVAIEASNTTGVTFTWEDDSSIISGLDGTSIKVSPTFDEAQSSNSVVKTYKVHAAYSICSEQVLPVNVTVYRPITGQIVAPTVICEGSSTSLDATSYGSDSYYWTSESDSVINGSASATITVSPEYTSTYSLSMVRGACSATDEYTLAVSQNPKITSIDSVYYNQRDVVVNGGTTPYTYWLDNNTDSASVNSLFTQITYGKHTAHVLDDAGCSALAEFTVIAPEIKIPIILSPNGDGVNDFFSTDVIREAFPNAKVSIFDRWGKKLVEFNGSDEGWDGTYNGNEMPTTDYWYEIEVKELNKTYTGHFTLMRQ